MAILDGIRVLDFSEGMAGSLATMILADNGAQVTKVEPPGGDPFRSQPAWIMWNRGKRGIVLDLTTDDGRRNAQRLAQQTDVLVESFRPGEGAKLGLGYSTLAALNPRLIHCSITGLGPKGAYTNLKPYEGVIAARSGDYVDLSGWMRREGPTYRARPNGSFTAANLVVQGVAAALRVRALTGAGQHVETSIYQGLQCYDAMSAIMRQAELGIVQMDVSASRSRMAGMDINLPYLVVRCKDGQWMQITNMAARLFPTWMESIGLGHIFEDPRFKGAPFMFPTLEDKIELRRMILEKMLEKPFDEWVAIFKAKGVAGDHIQTTQQAMDFPQTLHNGGVVTIDDPQVGPSEQIGPLAQFSATPSVIGAPAPLLGQHTAEVLREAAAPAATERAAGQSALSHPFDGMLILDFSTWLASPFGASLLADMGARVIKIEPPTGDEFRPFSFGKGRTFQGKESLVIDLKSPEGQQAIHRLIAKADAILHNMRGDAPSRIGIDYETARKINPNIVYLYAGSYGSTGPGAGRPAFHPIGGALSGGVLWQVGQGNEPPPNDVPMTLEEVTDKAVELYLANEGSPDVTSAIGVGTALALALYEKARSGKGQYVETTMLMSNCYICSDDFIRYRGKPPRQPVDRALRGTHALNRMYDTSNGIIFLCCPLENEWQALCRALGIESLIGDRRFATPEARLVNDDQLTAALAQVFLQRAAAEWESFLQERDVPCAQADKAHAADFLLSDPSVAENGFVVTTSDALLGKMMRQGPAVQFSLTPSRAEPAPAFGADGPAILAELGYAQDEITRLRAANVLVYPDALAVSAT